MTAADASTAKSSKVFWLIVLLGVIGCGFFAVLKRQLFFVAYLEAYLLILGTALGSMLILLIHQLVGGRWGFAIQRFLHAGIATLPWLFLLQLPLLFGMDSLYVWSRPDAYEVLPQLHHKDWYLNNGFFFLRAAFFWAAWLLISFLLQQQLRQQSAQGHHTTNRRLGSWALMVSVLTMSFAAVDWIMSLDPRFYSSIYSLIILTGFMTSAFAWIIVVQIALPRFFASAFPPTLDGVASRDLGNLLLMSIMLWAYGSFSQLILVWSGQLPEEILFYHRRFLPPWQALGWLLLILGFALPFILLLWRNNKKPQRIFAAIALAALIGHWLDLIWHVQPIFEAPLLTWLSLSLLTVLTLGGIWLQLFKSSLRKVVHGRSL